MKRIVSILLITAMVLSLSTNISASKETSAYVCYNTDDCSYCVSMYQQVDVFEYLSLMCLTCFINGYDLQNPYLFKEEYDVIIKRVNIQSAMEILKYLGRIPSIYDFHACSPSVTNAMEILKYLGRIPSIYHRD